MAPRSFSRWKALGLVAGILALGIMAALEERLGRRPAAAAGVTLLMAIWWLTEALPIYVTACVPLVAFPILMPFEGGAAANLTAAAAPYADPYLFLFAGGMCIAAAMEQCNLHRRIALTIMNAIGTEPRRILLGVLVSTATISLWISNTATAAMMLPIGLAVIAQFEAQAKRRLGEFGAAVMLAVAYGSNIGGIGTKIGTVPNIVFTGFMTKLGIDISFFQFLAIGLPFVIVFLPIAWWVLWRMARRDGLSGAMHDDAVAAELKGLGRMSRTEKSVFLVFLATAAVWILGSPIVGFLKRAIDWKGLLASHIEGGVAVLAALVLLSMRIGARRVLEIRTLRRLPWETLLLLGGGFSMAAGVQGSGLGRSMGEALEVVRGYPPFLQVLIASIVTVLLSAVASNVATTNVMLNVLSGAVTPAWRNTVLFSSTIAASCDFALPAGTPPNAIVFGSGYLTVPKMAKTGAMLDIAAGLLVSVWCYFSVRWVLP